MHTLAKVSIIVIIVAIFGVMLMMTNIKKKRWAAFAEKMNLNFSDGGILGLHTVDGTYKGYTVSLQRIHDTRPGSKRILTHMELHFPTPLTPRFRLSKEGVLQMLGKAAGGQDILVGDPDFDRRFVVKGSQENEIRALLNDEAREALTALLGMSGTLVVSEVSIQMNLSGFVTDSDQLETILNGYTHVAGILERSSAALRV